jgi:hypothetical protein
MPTYHALYIMNAAGRPVGPRTVILGPLDHAKAAASLLQRERAPEAVVRICDGGGFTLATLAPGGEWTYPTRY